MKKLVLKRVIVFTLLLVVVLTSTALGQAQTYDNEANALHSMGLLQGSEKGFELDRAPNRLEAGVMLIRLLGKEDEALKSSYSHPFKDVPSWANPYVGYLYTNNLTQGVGNGNFGSSNLIDAKSYMTFVLRALGYDDSKGDFSWDQATLKAKDLGIIDGIVGSQLAKSAQFLRGDMVFISYNSLDTNIKGQQKTLKEKLTDEGVIDNNRSLDDKGENILEDSINSPVEKEVDKVRVQEITQGIFPIYNSRKNSLEVAIIRDKLPNELKSASAMHMQIERKSVTLDDIIAEYSDDQGENQNHGEIFNSSGLTRAVVDFSKNNYYILLFNDDNNLIGYHLILEEVATNNQEYFRDLHVELGGEG